MSTEMGQWAYEIATSKQYIWPGQTWDDTADRVAHAVMDPYLPAYADAVADLIRERKFMPGGRYLYAAGRPYPQVQNCLLMDVEDSREGWADLNSRATLSLMSGAGIGVHYSKLREDGAPVGGLGGTSTGPLALAQMINEIGRHTMQGGSRRSAIWGGIKWDHPDALQFVRTKDWSERIHAAKAEDYNAVAPLDMTNVSVILDTEFFAAYHDRKHAKYKLARTVYATCVGYMLRTGEPGFSVDAYENEGENLRNACTEITSADNDDICNIGSIVLPRISSVDEMAHVTELATAFLLCGTLYSAVPYQAVADVRDKNRRLGLGVMGFAEWLATKGKPYGPDKELGEYLDVWARVSTEEAPKLTEALPVDGLNPPIKTRAIAPNGTIGIVAETTSSIEPLFAAAYLRRWLGSGSAWKSQVVVDAAAKRMVQNGVDPVLLDDNNAMSMAHDPARRLAFQSFVQFFVDHGISSTLNLPAFEDQSFTGGTFEDILMEALPNLRGVTTYPDGARGGQPLTPVSMVDVMALGLEGLSEEEYGNAVACKGGSCGI